MKYPCCWIKSSSSTKDLNLKIKKLKKNYGAAVDNRNIRLISCHIDNYTELKVLLKKKKDYNISPCNNGIKACTEIYDSIQQVIRGFSVVLTCPVVHQILIMGFSWVFKYFTLIFRPICGGAQDKIWRIYLFMPFKPSLLQSSLEMYIYMDLIHASD